MKALVTGGAGFIGSHVVDALITSGARVHALGDPASGRRANIAEAVDRGAELHIADVTDQAMMSALMARLQPDVVLHPAAHIDARRSVDEPAHDARLNV